MSSAAIGRRLVMTLKRWRIALFFLAVAGAAAAIAILINATGRTPSASSKHVPAPLSSTRFVGSASCGRCHAAEYREWQTSHHSLAMQETSERSVLGDFANAHAKAGTGAAHLGMEDGRYVVKTPSAGEAAEQLEVRYTIGVTPLQQYLISADRGRLQVYPFAWDTRSREVGGQRWFHAMDRPEARPGEPHHWMGLDQTWNFMCADCHSTNVRKGYEPRTATYRTTWSEISVGCEACHGPGDAHARWAAQDAHARNRESRKGLAIVLDERRGISWSRHGATETAVRSAPKASDFEIEMCARCHARRSQIADGHVAGQPLLDAFNPALLQPGLYYPDGQMREEVYNYGSFVQSLMYARGVTCSDCHEPHTGKLRATGDAVCGQCHAPAKYAAPGHHHHPKESAGTRCTACHMPTTTYMLVDARHDHSMRIPRPDRTLTLGTPNICNDCHSDRSAQWAADTVRRWFSSPRPGHQIFAETFSLADRGAPGVAPALAAIATDRNLSAWVRASALSRLAFNDGPVAEGALRRGLSDAEALVRLSAVMSLVRQPPAAAAWPELLARLSDPLRAIRAEAGRALAGSAEHGLDIDARTAFTLALEEYVAAQAFNADRPEAHTNLALLSMVRGNRAESERQYKKALELDPLFIAGAVNFADLYRSVGREAEGERVLRELLQQQPAAGAARHALGLSLVRQRRLKEALAELRGAVELAPDDAKARFVYAIALNESSELVRALQVLEEGLRRNPVNALLLQGAALLNRDAGRVEEAKRHLDRLRELAPHDPVVHEWARSLLHARQP